MGRHCRLVRAMRCGGRRLDLLGLTGTMLSDGDAWLLVGTLNSLPACNQAAEPEIIEILQVPLSEQVQVFTTLAHDCGRAGIKVFLSRADGLAHCICHYTTTLPQWLRLSV